MANGMYSTPIMGTSMALGGINPMQLQRNAMLNTAGATTPRVSTPMPNPMGTTIPQVSTPMPNPTGNPVNLISTNPAFFETVRVTEDTPELEQILTYAVYDSQFGLTLYKHPTKNIIYSVDDDLKENAAEILMTRDTGIQNVIRDVILTPQTPTVFTPIMPSIAVTDIVNFDQNMINDVTITQMTFTPIPVQQNIPTNTFGTILQNQTQIIQPEKGFTPTNKFAAQQSFMASTANYNRNFSLPTNRFYTSRI